MPTTFETLVRDECKGVRFGFESARAPLNYIGVGKEIAHALKYRGYTRVVERLAAPLMLGALDATDSFGATVPVPLHRTRLRRSGFNLAELLARGVARQIKTPPVSGTLQVVRRTWDQVELTAAGRRANIADVFRTGSRVRGRVLLIDDVFTTSATMSACAETLLRAGASEVHAQSLCRTV